MFESEFMIVRLLASLSSLTLGFAFVNTAQALTSSTQSYSVQLAPSGFCRLCSPLLSKKSDEKYRQAADYAMRQGGDALLILEGEEIVLEEYDKNYSASKPHALASGTKSFSGAMAIAAVKDGLLDLDEPVAKTITEWQKHPLRSQITVRQLLTLTSGISSGKLGFGRLGSGSGGSSNLDQVPTYAQAIKAPLTTLPGKTFQYSPVPLQIFGELMRRKLLPRKENPLDYLKRKIFDPIDLQVGDWQLDADGNPNLPSGAALTARDWARFGRLLERNGRWNGKKVLDKNLLQQCYEGTTANASYGLTFWLNAPGLSPVGKPQDLLAAAPQDTIMAAGADDQRLYVIPSKSLVIVRFGRDNSFEDDAFLSLLPQS
jgi:CubicO group peptidase (beta-lactamase class C family)